MEQEGKKQHEDFDRSRAFAAIDIGTTKIVALVGYKTEKGEIVVLGKGLARSYGLIRGEVMNIEQTVKSIQAAVANAKMEAGFFCKKVVVGIAGHHVRTLTNRTGINRDQQDTPIKQEDIDALAYENKHVNIEIDEEVIHTIPQMYMVDNTHEVVSPIGMMGRRLDANFHVVVCKSTALKRIKSAVEDAGLEVADLLLEPLAASQATLSNDEKTLGVAILDIGGGTTDIAILYNNIVQFTSVIPFGGNSITNDIITECKISEELAEKIKIEYGSAIQTLAKENEILSLPSAHGGLPKEISINTLSGIIQARMEEILDAALYELKTSGYAKHLNRGIVVTGGGSLLKNLIQLINFKISTEAKIGIPIRYIHYANSKEFNNPIYATSIGLLLRSAEVHVVAPQVMHGEEELNLEGKVVDIDEETNEKETKLSGFGTKIIDWFGDLFSNSPTDTAMH